MQPLSEKRWTAWLGALPLLLSLSSWCQPAVPDTALVKPIPFARLHIPRLSSYATISATIRPTTRLSVENTYLLTRLRDQVTEQNIFNNHIIRSKWNYQFNRQFSLRFIPQYTAVLSNRTLSSLQTTKQINADFLFTYLIHPGTAIYVGYNSDLQNLDRSLAVDPSDPDGNLLRTQNRFINDGRQFFVKVSYLFRY